jgi:hypothetical protein
MTRIETRLKRTGDASRRAADAQVAAAGALADAVRDAVRDGMSKSDIAKVAGISRVTVHKILRG